MAFAAHGTLVPPPPHPTPTRAFAQHALAFAQLAACTKAPAHVRQLGSGALCVQQHAPGLEVVVRQAAAARDGSVEDGGVKSGNAVATAGAGVREKVVKKGRGRLPGSRAPTGSR